MLRTISLLIFIATASICRAQAPNLPPNTDAVLSFETKNAESAPVGWSIDPPGSVKVDDKIVHNGKPSARIERPNDAGDGISGFSKTLPMNFKGQSLELRGFLRTENVTGFVGMWAREDGDSGAVAFDNMQSRQLKGTHDWSEYSIVIPVKPEARQLVFGVFVAGSGKAWVTDLQLLVDGKPIWDAPQREVSKTAPDEDHQFDSGSGISLTELFPLQIENLVTLGKVWGFLKYHHPAITQGHRHWDYDLFRVMPAILAAPDRGSANATLLNWINGLGPVAICHPCAKLQVGDIHLMPTTEWINNEVLLGPDLSQALRTIHANRSASGNQFYVALRHGVFNPEFRHELDYPRMKSSDTGLRLLTAFRFWNIIEYWFPYRDVLGGNWDDTLRQSIPKVGLAKETEAFQLELMALIAKANDTHANLWSSITVRSPVGACQVPVNIRFIENQAVVTGYAMEEEGKATGLKPGDVIIELDGIPVSKLVEAWTPYYADSNQAARLRDMAWTMMRGTCGEASVRIRRDHQELSLTVKRLQPTNANPGMATHDLPGSTFRLLSNDVAYLKLSTIKAFDVKRYINRAAGTKGLIIDIRNYPSEFVVFALGQLLVDKPTAFVRITRGDLSNPGAFHWDATAISLKPQEPHYGGKVVILVDEVTQSQAEYTAMAFRTVPGATVVGSTTAGADGNVSTIPLPGRQRAAISGIGVFYPDKRPTQQIGILADVPAKPTIAGIREGRDEVLEEAVRQILGRDTSTEQIRKMVKLPIIAPGGAQ